MLDASPQHGYALFKTIQTDLRDVCHIGMNRLYALLDDMEAQGLTEGRARARRLRPTRTTYQLTPKGRQIYDSLVEAPCLTMREMRVDFPPKLYLARQRGPQDVATLINIQREACQRELKRMMAQMQASRHESEFLPVIYDFRVGQIKAGLAWLDKCKARLVGHTLAPSWSNITFAARPTSDDRRTRPRGCAAHEGALFLLMAGLLLLLVLLPLLAIALRALPTLQEALSGEEAQAAMRLTVLTSTIALVVIVVLGTPTAWLIARRQIRGWKVIDAILDLPVVLPPSVAGIGLLMAFGRRGLLGPVLAPFGIELAFTTTAVIIAQVFVATPLFIRAAVIGLRRIDEDMESVAMVEGASPWQVFRFVTLPLSATALLTGGVLAWARALGEFGATILFAGNLVGRTQTMSLAIYINFQSNAESCSGAGIRAGVVLVLLGTADGAQAGALHR